MRFRTLYVLVGIFLPREWYDALPIREGQAQFCLQRPFLRLKDRLAL